MRISRRGALKGLVAGIVGCLTLDRPEAKVEAEEFAGETIPFKGEIPEKTVFGDCVQVPMYDIKGAIDYQIEHTDEEAWHHILDNMTKDVVVYDDCPFPVEVNVDCTVKPTCDLTDIYMSPEALEDIKNWGVDQIDDVTRKEILCNDDGKGNLRKCCMVGVALHES
jgi:hypothetical protein